VRKHVKKPKLRSESTTPQRRCRRASQNCWLKHESRVANARAEIAVPNHSPASAHPTVFVLTFCFYQGELW
jgi:hypothetical protein